MSATGGGGRALPAPPDTSGPPVVATAPASYPRPMRVAVVTVTLALAVSCATSSTESPSAPGRAAEPAAPPPASMPAATTARSNAEPADAPVAAPGQSLIGGPAAMMKRSLDCPPGSGEAAHVDYDAELMKKHCMDTRTRAAAGPAAILTFDGKPVARAQLRPNGDVAECTVVDPAHAAKLASSQFTDFAAACR